MQNVIFLPMLAVTTCAGYTECYISKPAAPGAPNFVFLPMPTVPGCDDLCRICGLLYFYLCQLWRPVQGMWIVISLPKPAVMTCAWQREGYIFTYSSCAGGASVVFLPMPAVPGCDKLCQVWGLLYFYLCQLWWPVPGIRSVIFLPMPAVLDAPSCFFFCLCQLCQAVTTCARRVDCYISTYDSCDDLYRVCRV